jgi:hydroxymethylpyrimidine pyrophosphatase-like HAD family hydrolase
VARDETPGFTGLSSPNIKPPFVFADLDGTLMARGEPLELLATAELLKGVQERGGVFVPVSARPVPIIATLFQPFSPVVLAIGNGGALIARIGQGNLVETLKESTLDLSSNLSLLEAFADWSERGLGYLFVFRGSDAEFEVEATGPMDDLSDESLHLIVGSRPFSALPHSFCVAPLSNLRPLGISFLAHTNSDTLARMASGVSALDTELPEDWRISIYPEFRIPGWTWLEIFSKSANKGDACAEMIRLLKSERRNGGGFEVIALGDAIDDLPMFRLATRSYCPSDAASEVRDAASQVISESAGPNFVKAISRII